MSILNETIIPFKGVGDFKLLESENNIISILDKENISYTKEIWDNKECTNPVPWTIIRVADTMDFVFAKNKLFEISVDEKFRGALPNGICIGMNLNDALSIDKSLFFDDWEEYWISPQGYWLEEDLDTKNIFNITIFIPEVLDDDLFDKYEW